MMMGRLAFGEYLRTLRKHAVGGRDSVLRDLPSGVAGLSRDNLGRYERGSVVPPADVLAVLLQLIGGDANEALSLLRDESATVDQARRLAQQRATSGHGNAAPVQLDTLALRELAALEVIQHEAAANPRLLSALARLFTDLRDQSGDSPNGPAPGSDG